MTIVFEDSSPNAFLEEHGRKIVLNGEVQYDWGNTQMAFKGDFSFEMFGGLILQRKERVTETIMPSDVREIQGFYKTEEGNQKVTWIPHLKRFVVETVEKDGNNLGNS